MCCRRASRFGHLCSQCSSVCGSSLHSGHVGSAAGSSRWAYALRSGVCPARRRARRTASAFLENCSYIMAVWGLLDGGSVTVRRMSAFAEANEMGRGQSICSGRGSLEVSVLGSSFIRFWAAERQLGRTRRWRTKELRSRRRGDPELIYRLSRRRWLSAGASRLSCCILLLLGSESPLGSSEADR